MAICDKVSNTCTQSWKEVGREEACSSWRLMFIAAYIYKEKLGVKISGMSCATVSLLPWAEMNSRKKKCAERRKVNLVLSQCQAASQKEGDSRVQIPARHIFSSTTSRNTA
jgi:hypothetical protein